MDDKTVEILKKAMSMGLDGLKELSHAFPLTLYYHIISDKPTPLWASQPISPARFRSNLELLVSHFRPLSVDEFLWHQRNGKPFPKLTFMITFDDGLADCYVHALPLLEEFKLDAIFFINVSVIGNKNGLLVQHRIQLIRSLFNTPLEAPRLDAEMERLYVGAGMQYPGLEAGLVLLRGPAFGLLEKLESALGLDHRAWASANKPYLDEAQLDDLSKRGFSIGAHGNDHFRFDEISLERQLSEFSLSMRYVMERFKPRGGLFAFPFTGDGVSYKFFELAAGLNVGAESFFGTAAPKENPGMPWLIERLSEEPCLHIGLERLLVEFFRVELVNRLAGTNSIERK